MKNRTSIEKTVIGLFALLILISGKLTAQSEILGHTYLGTFNGHAYYMSECPTTWGDAWSAALEMGGYLATITSQEEDEFLEPFAPMIECEPLLNSYDYRIGGAWIGLLTDYNNGGCDIWIWPNGETLGYTNWSYHFFLPGDSYCGNAAIIGYIGGNSSWNCYEHDYRWYNNYQTNATSRYIVEFDQDPSCSNPDKTYICHNGMTLCINESSLQNHLDHGDYAGPCGPCNSNAFTAAHHSASADANNDARLPFKPEGGSGEVAQVFPNPVTDQLHVDLRQLTEQAWVRLYLATGEKVYEQTFRHEHIASLDASSLPPGIILVEVRSGEEVWMRKVVKM